MKAIEEMRGASKVVRECANVQPDEQVLILSDWPSAPVAERVASAVNEINQDFLLVHFQPLEDPGNEPPGGVAGLLEEAEVIFAVTQHSLTHTDAAGAAKDENTRWISLPGYAPDQLVSGGLFADFEAMQPVVEEMAERFAEASEAHIVSDHGTDVRCDIEGRPGNIVNGLAREPGTHAAPGSIEANTSPVEGSTEGTIVATGTIPDYGIGELQDEVIMEIEDGAVTSLDGGKEARQIQRMWDRYDVDSIYNIAQLAVGMNPGVPEFNDRFIESHGRYGNVHFGIGNSEGFLGGDVPCPIHFDIMLADTTLELDGEVVLEAGQEFHL